jgi:P27 family predicted phage terminase small subunit
MARPKKSAEQKNLSGSARPDRERAIANASLLGTIPPPPEYFSDAQKKEWHTVCSQLLDAGILIASDLTLISMLVREVSAYNAAYYAFSEAPIVTLANGIEATSPHYNIMQRSGVQVQRISGLLGITPRARAQLASFFKKKDTGEVDPLADI